MKPGEILIGTTVAVIGGVTAFASSSQGEISPLMIFTTPTNPDVIVSCIGVLGAAFGLFLTWRGVQGTATRKQADELIEGQKQAKAGLAEANRTARGEGAQTRTAIAEDGEKTRALLEELLAERREARQAVGQAPDAQADLSFEEAVAAILSSTDAREAPARQALADKRPIDAADELMKVSRQEQAAIDDMGKATAARYREAGALYYGVNDKKALEAYREAAKLDISDVWSLIYLTRLEKSQMGNIGAARKWAEAGLKAAANERDRAAAYDALGNVALADNDVAGARAAYQASADIAKRLAAAEGAGADAQRDYSVSLDKLGDVALADKDVAGARAAYQASADIFKKLAAAEGAGADAQRDYSVSLEKLGNVALADNDVAGARAAYQASADIRKRLAAAEGAGADAQRDYSVSLNKLGNVALADNDVAGARAAYQASADIFKRLAAAEGAGADAQRDLLVSYWKLAKVTGEVAWWQEALVIVEGLAARGQLVPADEWMLADIRAKAKGE